MKELRSGRDLFDVCGCQFTQEMDSFLGFARSREDSLVVTI
jgi:hypothetical protein